MGQQKQQEGKQMEMEEQVRVMMAQILTPAARERLARVRLVKPERARLVESHLLRSAQNGQLRGKVDENQLRAILDQVSQQGGKTKVTYRRRRVFDSDEEDESDDDSDEEDSEE